MKRNVVLATLALVLAASRGAAAQTATLVVSQHPTARVLACTELLVSTPSVNWIFGDGFESGDLSAWGAPNGRFPVTAILDLDFEVQVEGPAGGIHLLHLRLLTPGGHHYQTLTAQLSSNSVSPGASARVDGFPRPLMVQAVSSHGGSAHFSLPVAGTPIVSSALFGHWLVEAYLDEQLEACVASSFELVQ